ncbi:4'-phosphopantetheinyl transferase superfamily protein [Flavobacterium sp. 5]|uniref:4'-phosphopantetheinyl transferase family protein n=1 Tax=Flavobacterium sp. 5 TaxID=2035199 RepID=UPI000C2C6EE7|nr:4'-phosphopantetheinyl transferase superfamily protein [Flavobacterium sp. 5]PKB16258.1 phosphopantetheinyl transferase [Flavobacterium sp. 5]
MPLYKTINVSPTTQILVWKVTESFDELLRKVVLKEKTQLRLNGMKSETHQRAFLSVRMLIQELGINDYDLHYDEFGKPYLSDHRYISITHSHNFAAIIVSEETVGIDMELQRDKIIRIADKFIDSEFDYLKSEPIEEYIKKLTVIWGAKEAIFKIRNEKGISFKDHIQVKPFSLTESKTQACLFFDALEKKFEVNYLEVENFTLVYAFEK